jgi:NADH dehydrogenase [ubiquinone] 1 alpha subcomplex assembly factor 1
LDQNKRKVNEAIRFELIAFLFVQLSNNLMIAMLLTLALLPLPFTLADFSESATIKNWKVVNDGVMGGKSESELTPSKNNTAIFKGDVSLKNNGGFASIRYSFNQIDISGATKAFIKLKGDKKNYQFRVKNNENDRHVYKHEFETSGKWETIEIPLTEMEPTFRGMRPNVVNYLARDLSQIGLLIANKKSEAFLLEISNIWLE